MSATAARIAVVIPCFRVGDRVLEVLRRVGPEVERVYVVDDACPERAGDLVAARCDDLRVRVIRHDHNQGVGGAVMSGYRAALDEGMDVVVKIDGDGQMAPELLPRFVAPILRGEADYTKGNRFFNLEHILRMPRLRLFGNAVLSFFAKLSTGYWNNFDPTNGYTAIGAEALAHLPLEKIDRRYFFETEMLFRLNTLRAVVLDVPMDARYGDETSSLRVHRVAFEFFAKHLRNTGKRIFYSYYLRDLSIASIELPLGLVLMLFGVVFGGWHWWASIHSGTPASAGTVMLSALPLLMGLQLLLAFFAYDIAAVPRRPLGQRRWLVAGPGSRGAAP